MDAKTQISERDWGHLLDLALLVDKHYIGGTDAENTDTLDTLLAHARKLERKRGR